MSMVAVKSTGARIIIMPLVLWTALFLPILHLHPQQGHDHEGESHSHVIVHADFWAGSAEAHRHANEAHGTALGEGPESVARTGLAMLTARRLGASVSKVEKSLPFFLAAPATVEPPQLVPIALFTQAHAPPGRAMRFGPNSPRSPPRLA
jgi:hypothetical protein